MKSICLVFSFLILFGTLGINSAALAGEPALSTQQQLALRVVVTEFLLLSGNASSLTPPGDGQTGAPPSGGDGGNDGIGISIIGPGSNQILIQAADGQVFNLTKINESGQELAADAEGWTCLRDNFTGLIWEVKSNNDRLHNASDSFTWYDTDPTANGGSPGFADNSGATCAGYVAGDPETYCNTQAYISRVNTEGWCGYRDWRMPSIGELEQIVPLHRAAPDLSSTLFPKGKEKALWSASPFHNYSGFAWHIYVDDGYAYGNDQSGNLPVLLVHPPKPQHAAYLNSAVR